MVHKAEALPVEAIVRGYLTGSGRKDYEKTGTVCGIELPEGLVEASRLPEPIFTPSTKAAIGDHDENISFDKTVDLIGREMAEKVRDMALALYRFGAEYAPERGIIIADTKFEFGVLDGELILIDEVMTPDSSRFWPADGYEAGKASRATTSSTCATTWRRSTGTRRRPAPSCPRRWRRRPPRSTWRRGAA